MIPIAIRRPFENEPFGMGFCSRLPCKGEFIRVEDTRYEVVSVEHRILSQFNDLLRTPGGVITVAESKEGE